MHIAISADHAGYDLKNVIISAYQNQHEFLDLGTGSATERYDYPDQADKLADAMRDDGLISFGILLCGSGIGIAIAGNRHRHLRVALCHDTTAVRLARAHNNANVLALGARLIDENVALDCVAAFFDQQFEGGRHLARVKKLY